MVICKPRAGIPKAASNTCITPNGGRSKNNTNMPTCWRLDCPCHGSVRQLSSIKKVRQDLKAPGLCKQKVLAMMVYLLEHTLIRIGNDAYARSNASFGLSTLRHRHVQIHQHDLQFDFRGKRGIVHRIRLHDARLARWLSRLRALPGQRLFQYVDRQGHLHAIGSAEVNAYLSQASQQ